MRQELKTEMNVLFLKDTGKLLGKEELKYLVIENDGNLTIRFLPIVHNDYLGVLYDYLAYDYDELDPCYQEKYKFLFKKIKRNSEEKYQYETKTYKKNNH